MSTLQEQIDQLTIKIKLFKTPRNFQNQLIQLYRQREELHRQILKFNQEKQSEPV